MSLYEVRFPSTKFSPRLRRDPGRYILVEADSCASIRKFWPDGGIRYIDDQSKKPDCIIKIAQAETVK